ncbi:kinase-like protein [Hypoxylon sp. NC1633]|nr:kinase-like protein [Hypoxylon sp. NC1633]
MDSEEEVSREEGRSRSEAGTDEVDTQSISVSYGAGSGSISNSHDSSRGGDGMEEHRNMMLASLLEDYFRTRAADFLNSTNPGQTYTRQSREVQPLARQLFATASRALSSNGIISELSSSDEVKSSRRQYLSALDSLVAGSKGSAANLPNPMNDLVSQTSRLGLFAHPGNDLKLTVTLPQPPSHYQSSFQELALLGKGGFGRVYQCFNPLDRKTYAVKKIQLSQKLAKRFRDGRLEELQHILREVQALATLDHPNIVRYHATWFEEEEHPPPPDMDTDGSRNKISPSPHRRLLLDSSPFSQSADRSEPSMSGGIIFAEDTPSVLEGDEDNQRVSNRQWFEEPSSDHGAIETPSLSNTSDIFTDGRSRTENISQRQEAFTAGGHTLYIQMSMYPMTLAQYISPSPSRHDAPRHCFHLLPSIRLLHAVLAGLRYVHSKGFIHQDIKPGNIFLSSPEAESQGGYCDLSCNSCRRKADNIPPRWFNPRIGDFGLVSQLAQGEVPQAGINTTTPDKRVGTAYYRPPSSKGSIDEKVDIFALGVVFIEMLCPCDTAMERVDILKNLQRGRIPQTVKVDLEGEGYAAEIVEEVVSLAGAMVDPNPDFRWSGSKVNEAIEAVLGKCEKT